MRKSLSAFLLVLLVGCLSYGQHGTAGQGNYPTNYMGDIWTGVLTAADDDTRQITLTYTKGTKTESFVGVLEKGYLVKPGDGPEIELKATNLPKGTKLTVFYNTDTEKVQGKKVQVNTIFMIEGIPNLRKMFT